MEKELPNTTPRKQTYRAQCIRRPILWHPLTIVVYAKGSMLENAFALKCRRLAALFGIIAGLPAFGLRTAALGMPRIIPARGATAGACAVSETKGSQPACGDKPPLLGGVLAGEALGVSCGVCCPNGSVAPFLGAFIWLPGWPGPDVDTSERHAHRYLMLQRACRVPHPPRCWRSSSRGRRRPRRWPVDLRALRSLGRRWQGRLRRGAEPRGRAEAATLRLTARQRRRWIGPKLPRGNRTWQSAVRRPLLALAESFGELLRWQAAQRRTRRLRPAF
eukprot:scaffold2908_cov257-Pinguiococcus_pyrenoidosus.AAC.12